MKFAICFYFLVYSHFSSAISFNSTDCFCDVDTIQFIGKNLISDILNNFVKQKCGTANILNQCISLININEPYLIESLTVSVDIFHERTEEITVKLYGPNRTSVTLFDKGSNSINIRTTYPTLTAPIDSLDIFKGKNVSGVWALVVDDSFSLWLKYTQGIQWSLNINYSMPITSTSTSSSTLIST